jgi:type IV pilus assembly protein PilQ
MISLRSLALLVCFGIVGVALAVCVGYSTDTPQPPKTAGEDARVSSTGHRPSAAHTTFVPAMPPGPLAVAPYPYLAQQITPPAINPPQNKSEIEALADILAKQLQPKASAQPIPGDIPGIATPPTAISPAPKPPGETTVKSEGDGLLSVNMTDANVREVLESLGRQGGMNVLVGKSVQGTISATLKRVSVTDAFDAVLKSTGYVAKREGKFVFVGSPTDFEAMEHALDKVGTRVYRPNYVTAAELQAIVQPLLTTDVGVLSVSTPSEGGIGADETNVGGDGFAGADVLVVRDYEAVLTEVDQMVDLVDIRPLQVHIEAMILSVKLKDTDKYGVDFQFLRNHQDTLKFGVGNPAATLADF